jgi:abequosyltransferase
LIPKHKPIISLCITSYNRVKELSRCLNSIKTKYINQIEIVVSEDCSPKKNQIKNLVLNFQKITPYKLIFNSNKKNIGFDRNLRKLIDISNGEYLLFVTDDDSLMENKLDELIKLMLKIDFSVGFTPYYDCVTKRYDRKLKSTEVIPAGMKSVTKHLYSSILLSGLIFKKSALPKYDVKLFANLIYSQVYLFAYILRKNSGYYFDIPIVRYIGDGENSFGKNDAAEKNELLANRKNYLSNLEFHKCLIATIQLFDIHAKENLMFEFSKQYSLKSYTGMYYARSFGLNALRQYWIKLHSLNIKLSFIVYFYYIILFIFGCFISNIIFIVPKAAYFRFRDFFQN